MFFKKKESVGGWLASRWQSYLFESRIKKGSLIEQVDSLGERLLDTDEDAPTGDGDWDARQEALRERGEEAKAFGSEVFSRLYGNPDQGEATLGWAREAHQMVDDMPEFEQLRRSVAGDPDFSALAARDILKVIEDQASNLKQASEEREDEEEQDGDKAPAPGDGLPSAGDKARSALRVAMRRIADEVSDAKNMMNGIAPGLEAAPPTHQQADPARYHLAESVKDSRQFKSIMEKAGRLRRIASKQKRVRDRQMRSEVVDIERGADLSRVLPSQIAGLAHPVMSKLVKRNIVERSLMQYRLEGSENKGRGPVVILLDRSGSMDGEREVWASAIGIAMIGVARKQKRSVTILGFNGALTGGVHMNARGEAHKLVLSGEAFYGNASIGAEKIPGGAAAMALHVAGEGSGGGTKFAPPVKAALHHLPSSIAEEKADLIFVTDGHATLTEELDAEIKTAKERGLRVFGMTVGGGSIGDTMQAICDESLDIEGEAEVGTLLAQ